MVYLEVEEVIGDQILGIRVGAVFERFVDKQVVAGPGIEVSLQAGVATLVGLHGRFVGRQLVGVLAIFLRGR